jgi:hypothetical protein
MTRRRFPAACAGVSAALASPAGAAPAPPGPIDQRNEAYRQELEQYFRSYLVEEYPARAARLWRRSYTGVPAFLRSVEPNRERYRAMFSPPAFERSGAVERKPLAAVPRTEWMAIPMGPLKAEALLAFPEDRSRPAPLVIAQHGIDSFPERVFGVDDPTSLYHDYGHALVKQGFAVLAPFNLTSVARRNRIERLARLADTTLPGIELARLRILLDEVLLDKRIDAERVGMWGISLGGMATMFWMPLEPRIRCGIVCAWFNHRRNKMVIADKRYSCFLETTEEHAFFRGWLTEFTDSDVASLICPRPLLVQTGKKDGIAWWPQVLEELEASKEHYRKLGIEDRIGIDLHDGGHEIRIDSGLAFLKQWLMR